jgi:hypothetical protein
MGRRWHRTSRRINFFYEKGNENHELGTGLSYIRESCEQLREWSSFVIRCHT